MVVECQCLSLSLLAPELSLYDVSLQFLCDLGLPGVSNLVLAWGGAAVIKKNKVYLFRRG